MPFTLYLLALAVFVMGTSEFMLAGLLPAIAAEFDVSVGVAGLLTSAFAVGMVVGAPLMAALSRRWPPRRTLFACLIIFTVSHAVGAMTPVFSVLFLVRVVSAFANAGFLAVALSTATSLVPANAKGRAVSILLGGTTIATVVGVPAGALLGAAMGWRATFWAIAVLCVPAILGVLRGVSAGVGQGENSTPLRAELGLLASPRLILMMTLGALINGGTFAAFTFLAPVVTESAGLSDVAVSVALVVFGLGSFLGVSLAGRLSDQRPRALLLGGVPVLLGGWVVLAAVASHPVLLIAMTFVQGFLSFAVGSTVIALVLYAASGAPTMSGSYATASLNLGAAVGPLLGALGLATGIGVHAPIWIASALTTIALVVIVFSRRALTTSRSEPGAF